MDESATSKRRPRRSGARHLAQQGRAQIEGRTREHPHVGLAVGLPGLDRDRAREWPRLGLILLVKMVGATGIEPVTPTMSR
jgi:hypothetical protein